MKSKLFTISVLTALLASVVAPAMAQGINAPGIDHAQQEISARIQQGLASGHITPSEAQGLYRREREIQVRENRMKADGNLNQAERQQLRQDLEGLRAEVERKISNAQVVGSRNDATPGIDRREINIRERIQEGVRSGRITENEARRLQWRERELERREARMKSHGAVSEDERRQLRRDLDNLRDDVERQIQNDRRGRYNR